ncbi:MAG TPA: 4'-phosphopantetheinyl transferase superfamily protein [Anaerolineaceae bacterium]|nr:4'-phosphopantetheinyl transferase superfamily protein [Anaerolineaceae bacterium]
MEKSVCPWVFPVDRPNLRVDQIQVWRANLDVSEEVMNGLDRYLSVGEKRKLSRYRSKTDRNRYTAARAILRSLLGGVLGKSPADLRFWENDFGKPGLVDDPRLKFNLSHANQMAVFAFSRNRELGVDIEAIRPELSDMDLAWRYFSRGEARVLEGLPPEKRSPAFFACWTRKEAYVKARGEGLSIPLDAFEVPVLPEEIDGGIQVYGNPEETNHWRLLSFEVYPGFSMALVGEGSDWDVRLYDWHPGLI